MAGTTGSRAQSGETPGIEDAEVVAESAADDLTLTDELTTETVGRGAFQRIEA